MCRELGFCLVCPCRNQPKSFCRGCLLKHLAVSPRDHAEQPTEEPDGYCLLDSNPAYHFCLCGVYVCAACLPKHLIPGSNHMLYPMDLLPVYSQDNSGRLLRQGELLDKFAVILTEKSHEIRPILIKKVTDTFEELHQFLQDSKTRALTKVNSYTNEFEAQCAAAIQQLETMKYNLHWTARTELEAAVLGEDWTLVEDLRGNPADWTFDLDEYKKKWESLSRLKNWNYLFQPPAQEPHYIAIANGKTQLFSLPAMNQVQVPTKLARLDGSLLCLPSTEWFFCDNHSCHQISSDFSAMQPLCELREHRINPGLAYYQGLVYLFGGHRTSFLSCTVECINLDDRSSRYVSNHLPVACHKCMPCRIGNILYFGALPMLCSVYLFHLPTERFEAASVRFEEPGSSISMAFPNNEVIFLSGGCVFAYRSQESEVVKMGVGIVEDFDGIMAPVKVGTTWYFLGKTTDVNTILAMSESDKEIQHVGVFEEGIFY